ncbi:hypothetical protein GXW82_23705 [Streptacidiphilus sp. 4-A2]|nr:hypothetical protein [Streptacidiphilus sp. 4-A2]
MIIGTLKRPWVPRARQDVDRGSDCWSRKVRKTVGGPGEGGRAWSRLLIRQFRRSAPLLDPHGSTGVAERSVENQAELADFCTSITIYGSDGAIIAFHDFRQAVFHPPLPALVATRLFADFLLGARQDTGRSDTDVTRAQIMGMRIGDLYEVESRRSALDLPFDVLCRREGWTAPWLAAGGVPTQVPSSSEAGQAVGNAQNSG